MPKDPTKNVDRYKIRGGHFNEFDFVRHHNELSHEQTERPDQDNPMPFPSEQEKVERIKELLAQYNEPAAAEPTTDREDAQESRDTTQQSTDTPHAAQPPSQVKTARVGSKKTGPAKTKSARKESTRAKKSTAKPASRPIAKSTSKSVAKPARKTTKAAKQSSGRKKSATATTRKASAPRKPMRTR